MRQHIWYHVTSDRAPWNTPYAICESKREAEQKVRQAESEGHTNVNITTSAGRAGSVVNPK